MHFEQHVDPRNQKYYAPMGWVGRKMDVVYLFIGTRDKTNMAVKTEKNSCGIARFPCGSTAFLLL